MQQIVNYLAAVLLLINLFCPALSKAQDKTNEKIAAKPLFRDPVYDGAADPTIIWNQKEKKWFMFYTNRRANAKGLDGVSWVHGTRIGIAESADRRTTSSSSAYAAWSQSPQSSAVTISVMASTSNGDMWR